MKVSQRQRQAMWAALRQLAPGVSAQARHLDDVRRGLRSEMARLENRPAEDYAASKRFNDLGRLCLRFEDLTE